MCVCVRARAQAWMHFRNAFNKARQQRGKPLKTFYQREKEDPPCVEDWICPGAEHSTRACVDRLAFVLTTAATVAVCDDAFQRIDRQYISARLYIRVNMKPCIVLKSLQVRVCLCVLACVFCVCVSVYVCSCL